MTVKSWHLVDLGATATQRKQFSPATWNFPPSTSNFQENPGKHHFVPCITKCTCVHMISYTCMHYLQVLWFFLLDNFARLQSVSAFCLIGLNMIGNYFQFLSLYVAHTCSKNSAMNYCVVPENIHMPPPPPEGILLMTTLPTTGFSKIGSQNRPPSPAEIPFLSHTPWKYYHSLWKPNKLFF